MERVKVVAERVGVGVRTSFSHSLLHWVHWFRLAPVCLALTACGGNPAGIHFDASVPAEQRTLMEGDLHRLSTLRIPPLDTNQLQLVGLPDSSADSLVRWLSDRTRYVVGESFSWEDSTDLAQLNSPGVPSILFAQSLIHPMSTGAVTVMWNLGAYLYLNGRGNNSEYTLYLANKSLRVRSPRVSVVQIGEGLFSVHRVPGLGLESTASSLLRLGTYFHEGRHTDGNGSHAAFPHALCPSGDYKDMYACEDNLNGPYAIQTELLKSFYNACHGCSETELQSMLLSIADYESRLLRHSAQFRDPRPEEIR